MPANHNVPHTLEASGFYRNKRSSLGLTSECRTCHGRTAIKSRDPVKARAQKVKDQANRRAREQGLKITAGDYKKLELILGDICQRCGEGSGLQWDHVLPLSKGGLHHPTNMQRLCRKCNERKQASCVDYRSISQIIAIRQRWVLDFNVTQGARVMEGVVNADVQFPKSASASPTEGER